ncbi:MAG: 3-deoxy-D-manno-octulosonic acid transferase [Gemmobacter sp.]
MSYSLGLTLYNLRAPAAQGPVPVRTARPAGRLVWLHAPTPDAQRPLVALARRLLAGADGVAVLLTSPALLPDPLPRGLVTDLPPPDSPAEVRAFLDHWHPDAGVIAEGELRPALVHAALDRGIPMMIVEGREPYVMRGREGWWPGLVRGLLAEFRQVLALDEPAARGFRRAGAVPARVFAAGRMELPSAALPCTEAERAALARALASRPVWLAAGLPAPEEAIVIAAHRALLRLSHRLLLIVVPEDPERAGPLAEQMEQVEGWTVARRGAEEEPGEETHVYIADTAAEYGLWYRLAPVTYLGGSLSAPGCRISPLAPAALGSALVHGPRSGAWGSIIGRLAAAQAAALVGSAADLAATLAELLAPDRAARLAQAAWAVTSEGAEVTDRVLALLRDHVATSRG